MVGRGGTEDGGLGTGGRIDSGGGVGTGCGMQIARGMKGKWQRGRRQEG